MEEVTDNAIGAPEIRTNAVGASEVADNSIDGGELIDGGLTVRDIAKKSGPFQLQVNDLLGETCRASTFAIDDAAAGDLVLVAPRTTAWPGDRLSYTANTTGENRIRVIACNISAALVPAATYEFNYALLGF